MTLHDEVRWWIDLARVALARPAALCFTAALVWWVPTGGLAAAIVLLAIAVGLRLWARRHPASYARCSVAVATRRRARELTRTWTEVCASCGLERDGAVPVIRRRRVRGPHVELLVTPLLGQTLEHFAAVSEPLRSAVQASRLRLEPQGARDVLMIFTVVENLRAAFPSTVPNEVPSLDHATLGRQEDGRPWRLALGPHTLVAGSSGAGKGSVFWSFALALAPAVRAGSVHLHGIDLKAGMEVLMARGLFTSVATDAVEAVALLEDLVTDMQERARQYAGTQRSHSATPENPLHIVMIDELAALTAYNNERELQRRAETAINLLCSQGRAPGFMVFACLQDPRKEVIPSRGLFTQMVGLRLKDISETTMVLGETAALTGAHCHRITREVPGTGYVVPEDGGHPILVRAGFASDELIRNVAQTYAAPVVRDVDTTAVRDSLGPRRRPRSREDVA